MMQAVNDFFDDRNRRLRDMEPEVEAVDQLCSKVLGRHISYVLDRFLQN